MIEYQFSGPTQYLLPGRHAPAIVINVNDRCIDLRGPIVTQSNRAQNVWLRVSI